MNSWGIVGQPGQARELLADARVGQDVERRVLDTESVEAPEVRMENPQAGCSGVPFMKSITLFSLIAFSMKSRISVLVIGFSRSRSLDRKGVDRPAHLVAENAVDELVLVDPAEALEAVGNDLGAEVVAAARQVLHMTFAPGKASSMRCLSSSLVGIGAQCYIS